MYNSPRPKPPSEDHLWHTDTETWMTRQEIEKAYAQAAQRLAKLPVSERITRYEFCLLPLDHEAASSFTITVEWRGGDRWAVLRLGKALDAEGRWQYERSPSNRSDDFIRNFRHDLETAKRLAREKLPTLIVNGMTAEFVLKHIEENGW